MLLTDQLVIAQVLPQDQRLLRGSDGFWRLPFIGHYGAQTAVYLSTRRFILQLPGPFQCPSYATSTHDPDGRLGVDYCSFPVQPATMTFVILNFGDVLFK